MGSYRERIAALCKKLEQYRFYSITEHVLSNPEETEMIGIYKEQLSSVLSLLQSFGDAYIVFTEPGMQDVHARMAFADEDMNLDECEREVERLSVVLRQDAANGVYINLDPRTRT